MPTEAKSLRAGHFQSLEVQGHAARMGMWVFLGTEILLFGGLFVGYVFYRFMFREAFHEASRHLLTMMGVADTVVLLTSSLTAVLSLHYLRLNKQKMMLLMLALTIFCGLGFLVMHGYEYWHDIEEGALPGRFYHLAEVPLQGANLFYTLYFLMTGLHSLHVFVGAGILSWMLVKGLRGQLHSHYDVPLEVSTLYWHLIDLIWIFLFPLLYLI